MATPEDVLKDNMFLCGKSLNKTESLLEQYQNNPNDNGDVLLKFQKLLTRMEQNIQDFLLKINSFVKPSVNKIEIDEEWNSPRKRIRLSLKRSSTQETSSEREALKCTIKERLQDLLISDDDVEQMELSGNISSSPLLNKSVKIECKHEHMENIDFNDTIFELPCQEIDSTAVQTSGDTIETTENRLEALQNKENEKIPEHVNQDKDKIDFLSNFNLQSVNLNELPFTSKVIKNTRYYLRKRKICVLNEHLTESENEESDISDIEAEQDLKDIKESILDEFNSSDYNSNSLSSDLKSIISNSFESMSETELSNNEEITDKQLRVEITPLEKLNDDEIERLCSLNNVNKWKCERYKATFTSSSTALSDFTSGTTTPDLPEFENRQSIEMRFKTPEKKSGSQNLNIICINTEKSELSDNEKSSTKPKKNIEKNDAIEIVQEKENVIVNNETSNNCRNGPLLKEKLCTDRQLQVEITPLEKLKDDEIDRLCNLNNLNKRKYFTLKKRKYERCRKICTSSSALGDVTSGSTTPDLSEFENGQSFEKHSKTPEKDFGSQDLDIICINTEESEHSDNEKSCTKQKKNIKKKNVVEIVQEEENVIVNNEASNDWRNDPLLRAKLWTDSDDSKSDKESDNDQKNAVKKKKKIIKKRRKTGNKNFTTDSECSIISCSTEDSCDSDVEFISNTYIEAPFSQSKGRRNIQPLIEDEKLTQETRKAKEEEDARILRLVQHSRTVESIQSQHDEIILDIDPKTDQSLITVNWYLSNRLKQHQIEGVKFMWNACYESVDMVQKNNEGSGCILAHCMGLGKTFQVIALIHTLFTFRNLTKTEHILIICPLSTVLNWKNEFKIAFNDMECNFEIFYLVNEQINGRYQLIKEWHKKGGVLVMGYEQFTAMTNEKRTSELSEIMKTTFLKALINPGPDLIVCDEGHMIRNGKTQKNQSLMRVRTRRRIVLTGTPLQNNLKEYYYMVDFVKPHLLGTYKEYSNRFELRILNGQYHNSTKEDVKIMKKTTHVLNKLLKNTVYRLESSLLKQFLPELKDYAIFIKLHPKQIEIYTKYINCTKSQNLVNMKNTGFFSDFNVMKQISFHPFILLDKDLFKSTKSTIREQDLANFNNTNETPPLLPEKKEWLKTIIPSDAGNMLNLGTKMVVLFQIIQESKKQNDKILIFAHTLLELNCIEHFFKQNQIEKNRDYYRMDGKTKQIHRDFLCKQFNSPTNSVYIFLMTHKVGGLGLNLVAANRVVLIGSHFNPCYDSQSIYRAYRFGQTKPTYAYRLLSMGTAEEKIYQKCVLKLAVATTVIDKYHVTRHFDTKDLQYVYEYDFDYDRERPIPILPSDKVLAHVLGINRNCFKYHEHQDLLANRPEEELNEEEKRLAWDEYNREEQRASVTAPSTVVSNQNGNAIYSRQIFPLTVGNNQPRNNLKADLIATNKLKDTAIKLVKTAVNNEGECQILNGIDNRENFGYNNFLGNTNYLVSTNTRTANNDNNFLDITGDYEPEFNYELNTFQ